MEKKNNDLGQFKNIVESITKTVNEDFNKGEFLTEQVVYSTEHKIAGTSDLIIDNDNSFSIVDFKTNKQIKYTNIYQDKNLLPPVSHLPNSEFFKYSLQLSFYAYFYNLKTSKHIDRLCFYWLKRKNTSSYEDLNKFEWIRFNTPYLKEEVESCIKYAKKS